MNTTKVWLLLCAISVICLTFWLLATSTPDTPAAAASIDSNPHAHEETTASAYQKSPNPTGTDASPTQPKEERLHWRVSPSELELYLSRHGRSTDSLLGAFAVNKDVELIREALKRDPDNAMCLIASALYLPEAEALQSVATLCKNLPNAAYPEILSAKLAFGAGHPEDALKSLQSATSKKEMSDFREEFTKIIADIFMDIKGYDVDKANGSTMGYPAFDSTETVLGIGRSVETDMKSDFGVNPQALREKAATAMSVAQMLQQGTNLSSYRQGLQMEANFLPYLATAGETNYLNKPIQDYISELDRERKSSKELLSIMRALPDEDPAVYKSFLEQCKSVGQIAALRQIQAQRSTKN